MKKIKTMITFAFVSCLAVSAISSNAFAGDVKNGKKVYDQNCAACHGVKGKGDGLAAAALKPKPNNFAKGVFKYGGKDADLEKLIKSGKGPMPKWSGVISDKNIKDVVSYIRTLKK